MNAGYRFPAYRPADAAAIRGEQMRFGGRSAGAEHKGLLTRLARDKRGNTLAIGAAALIPLAGVIGGGVDMSRIYMTKTRLQHACDAGVLAGRGAMGGGSWAYNNNAAEKVANQFFDANWREDSYGSTSLSRKFTETDGVVTGEASVRLPMTLMRIFNRDVQEIAVRCDAEMRLLNTDVMFVLDTTGSMEDVIAGDTRSKIDNLRLAVKCFYQILAQLDISDEDCEEPGNEPTGGIGPDAQLRFGFIPYSSNVNVGKLLDRNHVADRWPYQTREFLNRYDWTDWYAQYPEAKDNKCTTYKNTAVAEYRDQRMIRYEGKNYCYREQRDKRPVWRYAKIDVDVSDLKNVSGWNNEFTRQKLGDGLEGIKVAWKGCVEERKTVRQNSYDPIPEGAKDLDFELVPTSSDPESRWGPVLPDLHFWRLNAADDGLSHPERETIRRYPRGGAIYACPTESRKLTSYSGSGGPTNFMNYVNSLEPIGGTYHDIGMIWGLRLLSPKGIFASENRVSAKGGAIERHLIFMTDGDTDTSELASGAYGVPWYDRRQTSEAAAPSAADTNNQVDRRFEALCKKGQQSFTIWVIGFGALTTGTLKRLEDCASPGRFFHATDGPKLQTTFREIAEQIGQLRLRNDRP